MTNDERIDRMLHAAKGQLVTVAAMMKATRSDAHSVINAVSRLRHRYGPRLVRKQGSYALVKGSKRHRQPMPVLHIPADLWRGWYNPVTGITAVRLGLG